MPTPTSRAVPSSAAPIPAGVSRCGGAALSLGRADWPFAREHAGAIDAYWQAEAAKNARYFNGRVHVLADGGITDGVLTGELVACDFKSFLYWRAHPALDSGILDAFGSAIVITADNAVMLGVQVAGQLNSGLAYPPGGLTDPRDVDGDGHIDIGLSAARELAEETGLTAADVTRQPGLVMTSYGHQLSIGVVFRTRLTAGELGPRIADFLARDPHPELARVVFVRTIADAQRIATPAFVEPLLRHLLPA